MSKERKDQNAALNAFRAIEGKIRRNAHENFETAFLKTYEETKAIIEGFIAKCSDKGYLVHDLDKNIASSLIPRFEQITKMMEEFPKENPEHESQHLGIFFGFYISYIEFGVSNVGYGLFFAGPYHKRIFAEAEKTKNLLNAVGKHHHLKSIVARLMKIRDGITLSAEEKSVPYIDQKVNLLKEFISRLSKILYD